MMIELDFVPQIDSSNQIDERCLDLQKKKISQVSKKKFHQLSEHMLFGWTFALLLGPLFQAICGVMFLNDLYCSWRIYTAA
ncbi:DNA repair DEAD helicase RAD3/XP-D subfamily protein [Arabidopsis thaliana]|uniref:DNA repair DEAD helicase RAD3/XP-D subfamily protein n=1 Tax=Arabidopsis thaliana TaxID=3702 RepID=Q56YE8_ARATH|nr:DNA repair DEAD helicase RAD3/XP-D subfamily protein [Arabidopsis thaliana]NP_001321833.1 DNA repair DEAD helicase RAD3/XP-D subfamily protein [Arabidopsis thaliana]ANM59475.1 DNA repair DEAD helicase RAD3/XP-D subfamily protein [Arabidopsis thaliana]ANM59477.1 DNA repair DEAD helicase RAD3/XP-D subfamily protein [Arabidopsis thaliana]BAD94274.1 hypothetical protein [Arabidopsis thaliana]|eukprot:NP_001321831.1 DNA repair DEAD helicase RAD3/XP-D subfamily protein [Arabidopsis thaliana]